MSEFKTFSKKYLFWIIQNSRHHKNRLKIDFLLVGSFLYKIVPTCTQIKKKPQIFYLRSITARTQGEKDAPAQVVMLTTSTSYILFP